LKELANKYNEINILGKVFYAYYFDSTEAYSKFYVNKIEKGLSLMHFDKNGDLSIFIEFGKELVVNYMNQFYFYDKKEKIADEFIIELVTELGLTFSYKTAKIYNEFCNYSEFSANYYKNQQIFLYLNHYDNSMYKYAKEKVKPYSFEKFYKSNFRVLETKLETKLTSEEKTRFNFTGATIRELLIETIENRFYEYSSLIKYFELEQFNYGELNIYEKLISQGRIETMLELVYTEDEEESDDIFKLLYRQPVRRK